MGRLVTDWPGKSGHEDWARHPAVYHMPHVVAVAERLLIPCPFPAEWKAALALPVALQDPGKASGEFRATIRAGKTQDWRHREMTKVWLYSDSAFHGSLGVDDIPCSPLIAGHHGKPQTRRDGYFRQMRGCSVPQAREDVPVVIAAFSALWPEAPLAALSNRKAKELCWWLVELTTVAAWIGSNTGWFPPRDADLDLPAYLALARRGWRGPCRNPVRCSISRCALCRRPRATSLFLAVRCWPSSRTMTAGKARGCRCHSTIWSRAGRTCLPWLADNRRKSLLADVGISAIDQALFAAMKARFGTLRLWGLSSKILIVDEAHEIFGDAYMAVLLHMLLSVHAAQGGARLVPGY